jgi:hypothetical protein
MYPTERRRFTRVTLRQPVRGVIGDARVYLVDGSAGGIRIVHRTALPTPGAYCRVEISSDLGPVKLDCEIVRTVMHNALYHSGLSIVAADRQSSERLKTLIRF